MSDKTKIEWCDATWNAVTGCTEVSPGCDHCYAKTFAERFRGVPGHYFEHGFDVQLRHEALNLPRRWREPRRIFVNSMSDLFHAKVPGGYVYHVWSVMAELRRHTFLVLTKRPERMRRFVSFEPMLGPPLPNVWLGVSCESAEYLHRIEQLRLTPAAVRFLSCEPLLGPLPDLDLSGIDWVIAGGESGPGARPMATSWVRDLRDQCQRAGVAFFFKQRGEYGPDFGPDAPAGMMPGQRHQTYVAGESLTRWGKRLAGRLLDGREWNEFPREAVPA